MSDALLQLGLFSAKALILVALALIFFAGILILFGRGKEKLKGHLTIKHLNERFSDTRDALLHEILPKKKLKLFLKEQKKSEKTRQEDHEKSPRSNIFMLNFHGDIKASAVSSLREEITAILSVAKPEDEVVVCVESGGGMVNMYGLAAAQLQRLKQKNIPLTVCVDKVAASGGYMMACIADKLLAAPFAIIGSIGVIVQVPNFHRLLKEKHIDFEQLTAGSYKRTLTLFGENTEEGRHKLQQEIEVIHLLFKELIHEHRPALDIDKISTGEYWLGKQALDLKLIDEINISDDYLMERSKHANLYELRYTVRKSFAEKFSAGVSIIKNEILGVNKT